MKKTVFIDGQHGTTGLKIHERLMGRDDIELIEIPIEQKKEIKIKERMLNEADVVFLCLPDDAARESISLIKNERVRVLDPSTAHRTSPEWVYGIPELKKGQREDIKRSKRVSVPGCHATGFVMCMHPLVSEGFLPANYPASCYSISGYSGGGKSMINEYENDEADLQDIVCRVKNLNLEHKHLPEMKKYGLLDNEPIFTSIVGNYYRGMLVFLPINFRLCKLATKTHDLITVYKEYYKGEKFVSIAEKEELEAIGSGFLSPTGCNDTNRIEILVFDKDDNALVVARFDNLGKGASGAAVQCMNIMIEAPEEKGI